MEFVEGETLQNLIKRSGRLEVKLALEIATQIAAGLAAVHKQKLVHRDTKPGNIMVSLEEGGTVTAKIIDLGLAKSLDKRSAQTTISTPGAFAGTPAFASPEQIAGVQVDIRSDLYSLGVTLWEMVAGKAPFRGTAGEVMHQHQHAPLPLEQLVRRNSHAACKTGTRENFGSKIARYGKRCFWARRGHRFPGFCMGQPTDKRRYHHCLGWCREVHARQPLARANGC